MSVAGGKITCLAVEVKAAHGSFLNGLLKLIYEMKLMLHTMIEQDVPDAVVYGIIVEGTLMLCRKLVITALMPLVYEAFGPRHSRWT